MTTGSGSPRLAQVRTGADGEGVATPGSLVSFQAALSSHTQIIITSTWEDVMVIAAAGINVNDGGFTTGEPTTGRNSVIIPTGEDGRYQFGLNMRVNGTASGAGARRDIKVRVVVYRASALQASPIVLGSEYFRGHADVDGFTVNMSTIGDFEAADEIRVQAQAASGSPSLDFSDETSGIWVSKVQPPLIVVGGGAAVGRREQQRLDIRSRLPGAVSQHDPGGPS